MTHGEIFEVRLVARCGGSVLLALAGELDAATAPLLRAELDEHSKSSIVLDCSGLGFIDSVAIGVLVAARNRAKGDALRLSLYGTRGPVRRTLEIAGVYDMFARRVAA